MYQDEVSGALWSWESINLLTCALTHTRATTTMVICTDYKSKDNFLTRFSDSISMIILFLKMIKLKKRSSGLMVQL